MRASVAATLEYAVNEAFSDGVCEFAYELIDVQEYVKDLERRIEAIRDLVDGPN